MPIPIGTVIAAGGQVLTSGINALSQGSLNKKTRRWNQKMYEYQRRDALSDWHMQNQYNSPAQQMQRLKEAGLSPHLVYGNGSATNEAGNVRSAEAPSWSPRAAQVDLQPMGMLDQYVNMEMKQAQTDNVKEQTKAIAFDMMVKAAQAASIEQGTEMSKYDLSMKKMLQNNIMATADANLKKIMQGMDIELQANERAVLANTVSVQEGIQRILLLRKQQAKTTAEIAHINQQIAESKKNVQIKELDRQLKASGLQPSDPAWQRAIGRVLGNLAEGGRLKIIPDSWQKNPFRSFTPTEKAIFDRINQARRKYGYR